MSPRVWPLAFAAALVSVACAAPTPQPQATQQTGPKSGGTLNVRVTGDPFDWDLTDRGKSLPMNGGQPLGYSSLLGFKTGPGIRYDERQLRPELAEKWEVSPDAKPFTFHLRPSVKWANLAPVNGRDLTSADVKWSYEYWSRTGWAKGQQSGQYEWMYEGMEGIDTPDPSTVTVRFKQGFGRLIRSATDSGRVVVLDPRILTARYGKNFLNALPEGVKVIRSEPRP